MVRPRPLDGYVVAERWAADVVAPPYDTLTEEQRRTVTRSSPDSFLQVLPSGDADPDELLANRAALERLIAGGRFVRMTRPSLGILTLEAQGIRTTAVLGDVDVDAYVDGRVLPHEHVRDDRVSHLVRHLEVVGIASSPVCVVHRPDAEVTALTERAVASSAPVVSVETEGLLLGLHLVTEPAQISALVGAVDAAGPLYVADGHHRAAAVAAWAARALPNGPHQRARRVLTAAVPADGLRVLAFHRRVDHLTELTVAGALDWLTRRGIRVEALPGAVAPRSAGVAHLTICGRWWALDLTERRRPGPVEGLDVRLVERELLEPPDALGAGWARARVEPVPDPIGLDALVRRGSAGLALYPPDIDDVMAVADAGRTMPPKSTYLAPKLRSGLLVVPR